MTTYQQNYDETYPFSNQTMNTTLAASTAISWTVPGDSKITYRAKFSVSSGADVWVRLNDIAVVPVSNTVTETSNQERIDVWFQRYVRGGDTLSFISTGTPQVGVSLLQLPIAN
ncbi:MAG: hypothetical protein C5B43_03860 [Verrucomicrobia bacterium]|nr:MAG: hypothetical protein C5B43_03860 [Verrucomicrobiota bacterium]